MKLLHHILRRTAFLLLLLAFAACAKTGLPSNDKKQEVTFSSKTIQKGAKSTVSLKSATLKADYAVVGIGTKLYKIPVYVLNGVIYTTSIKLDPGNYTLTKFLLMNSGQTASDSTDDVVVYALPMAGADYAAFVEHPAGFNFSVNALNKKEVQVEVLLFNPADYEKFGFDFTVLPNTAIRHQLFSGRFIPADFNAYTGSLYAQQSSGLQADMPAIFRIDVYRNGAFVKSYNNKDNLGLQALRVSYPDDNQSNDQFRFDLYVYGKSGTGFDYRFIRSWEFSNGQQLHHSSDGIVHFVVGNAQDTQADYAFGPYINLPDNYTLVVDQGFAPGSMGSYFDGTQNVPAGYAMANGTYRYWCGTDTVSINLGYVYKMDVYSSLIPDALPAYTRHPDRWNEVNWLFNHLNNYAFYDWDILQGAAWMILNDWDGMGHSGVSDANALVLQMVNAARSHADFVPGYGQKAAIILVPQYTGHEEQTPKVQVVFTFIHL